MGGSAKAPRESDEQRRSAELQRELMEVQLEQTKNPEEIKLPKPQKILPSPPPPRSASADVIDAEREARRVAAGRINTARGTLFAGESSRSTVSNGRKTLLG
jgi:hypothetical protein